MQRTIDGNIEIHNRVVAIAMIVIVGMVLLVAPVHLRICEYFKF